MNTSLTRLPQADVAHTMSEAEALGIVVWLWTHSNTHRSLPISAVSSLILPAIQTQQYVLLLDGSKPVAYAAWAALNEVKEEQYLQSANSLLTQADWCSGDRYWITDFVAPFGHARTLRRHIAQVLNTQAIRFLYHKGSDRGIKILEAHGLAVLPQEARHWFDTHPVCWSNQPLHSSSHLFASEETSL